MAVLHGAVLTLLAEFEVFTPTDTTLVTSIGVAVLVGAAALWSAVDAWLGLAEAGKVWFITSLITGLLAGILYVVGRAIFVDQTGASELSAALTGGAAFSALLVLVPAGLGLFFGSRVSRSPAAEEAETDLDSSVG
ncbi:hypothetical protein QMK34_37675 [Amycolatopsis sp. H20-H5]|nr:hypothetical protein [Amycolatopsis sp. H20-H5]MEC3980988.1 hypothetical protein [Amycolatopsis sp. H20-H5]